MRGPAQADNQGYETCEKACNDCQTQIKLGLRTQTFEGLRAHAASHKPHLGSLHYGTGLCDECPRAELAFASNRACAV